MLLGSNKQNRTNELEDKEDLIIHLLYTKHYAQAYQLLTEELQQKERETSLLFNLALCLFYTGHYAQTLYKLEEALVLLSVLPRQSIMMDDDYRSIVAKQNQTGCYQSGITKQQLACFPETIKDHILRLKVDCYLQLEQWEQVLTTGATLKSRKFKNVDDAMLIAQNKLKTDGTNR